MCDGSRLELSNKLAMLAWVVGTQLLALPVVLLSRSEFGFTSTAGKNGDFVSKFHFMVLSSLSFMTRFAY